MHPLLIYSIQVNTALALFYLLYVAVLKRDTFFRLRRFFLLSVIFFSFLYPLFTVPALSDAWAATFPGTQGENSMVIIGEPGWDIVEGAETAVSVMIPIKILFILLYAAVTLFFMLRFLFQLISIYRIWAKSEKQTVSGLQVYHLKEDIIPFSFFNLIFIHTEVHSETELNQILLHERSHARQGHSVDVVLAELLCIFFWWNPFVWLMKREMTMNLEYLADNGVLSEGIDSREYQYHLLRLTYHESAVPIVNNFNVSQLKQRIMMMNKTKSPATTLAKYLLIVPLLLLFITANSIYAAQYEALLLPEPPPEKKKEEPIEIKVFDIKKTEHGDVFEVVEGPPSFPGGMEALLKYLSDNIVYPQEAQEKGVQGRVICRFIVMKDGTIEDINVLRGVDPLLDAEAVRVIAEMPKWSPGKQNGELVNVYFTVPIQFRLYKEEEVASPDMAENKSVAIKTDADIERERDFMKFISNNIRYPIIAQDNGIKGLVKVTFSVDDKGGISDVKVIKGVDPSLEKEVIRVLESMPADSALKREGGKANPEASLSVHFKLLGENVTKTESVDSDITVVAYGPKKTP